MRAAWLLATVLLVTGCPSSPRFGDLRFGPRKFALDVPATVIELDSGMVIALVPDDRTNLVSVDVRYRVGAAEDPAGRAGMAHLVEHLSFEPLEAELAEAALVSNAFTSPDHTHYWSIGLADRLDDLLELEARRMDPRCDQLTEAVFLRERDVVIEEIAQRGRREDRAAEHARAVWGADHPYGREITGGEIAGATRDEVCRFVDDHYAPNRALLVVTGRFDAEALAPRITRRFEAIDRRSQGTRAAIAAPALGGARSEHITSGKRTVVIVSFAAPPWWDDEVVAEVAAERLADEIDSRGWRKRRFRTTGVSRGGGAGAGTIEIRLQVRHAKDIDRAIESVYEAAAAMQWRGGFRGLEADRSRRRTRALGVIDGFWGRGAWIADRLQYAPGDELFATTLASIDGYDSTDVADWASANFVSARSHVAIFRPAKDAPPPPAIEPIATSEREHDLAPQRIPVDPAEAERPLPVPAAPPGAMEEYQLDNGLRVVLAPLDGARMVDARLIFPIGDSAGDAGDRQRAGYAAYALRDDLSPDEYVKYDRERLDWVFGLGTLIDTDVDERATTFSARGISLFADWHVWRLFWRIDAGIYPPDRTPTKPDAEDLAELRAELERLHGSHDMVVTSALFGDGASWFEDLLSGPLPRRAELRRFREDHYVPRGATLVVAGGFDPKTMRGVIEQLFGSWRDRARGATPAPATTPAIDAPRWVAITDRDAIQLRITVAVGGLARDDDRAARAVLGEMLHDRLLQVREGQGASYGIASWYQRRGNSAALRIEGRIDPHRGPRAMATVLAAVATLRDGAASLPADFVRARRRALAHALARAGTASDVAGALEVMVVEGLPLDGLDRHAEAIAELTPAAIGAVAARDLAAGTMVVVVSGPGTTARELLEGAGVAAGDITDHAGPD